MFYYFQHRNSIVDEWNIPYENIRILERVGCGPVGEVYRGNWHGEVAIKRFNLLDATPEQIGRFKEEVSILKKTRHENLALFMGASLTVPNLAIVTRYICVCVSACVCVCVCAYCQNYNTRVYTIIT